MFFIICNSSFVWSNSFLYSSSSFFEFSLCSFWVCISRFIFSKFSISFFISSYDSVILFIEFSYLMAMSFFGISSISILSLIVELFIFGVMLLVLFSWFSGIELIIFPVV